MGGGDDILRRVPPHNLDAEQSVLGAVLLDNASLDEALGILSASDFYREAHRQIFARMIALSEAHEPIDAITLCDKLRQAGLLEQIGGAAYIAELAAMVPSAATIGAYASRVRRDSILRSVGSLATEIAAATYEGVEDVDEFLDKAERELLSVGSTRIGTNLIGTAEATREALRTIEILFEQGQAVTGVATGFREFDRLTAGLHAGNLIVIAARPSMGKTSLACDFAMRAAFAGVGVAMFSVEMTREEVMLRMLCSEAGVDAMKMRAGILNDRDFGRLAEAAAKLGGAELAIDDDSSITPVQIKASCRRHAYRLGRAGQKLGLVIVDYIQLMNPGINAANREQEVAHISKSLKGLAKELKIPVVALAQLNRQVESRAERRPVLADLRESGAIENDADVIAFIYRDEVYHPDTKEPGIAEIIIAKQRNGPTETVKLAYLRHLTRFEDLDERFTAGRQGA